jgi:hypothetical protein
VSEQDDKMKLKMHIQLHDDEERLLGVEDVVHAHDTIVVDLRQNVNLVLQRLFALYFALV